MAQEINVLVVETGKAPRPATVLNTMDAFAEIVGGPVEAGVYLPQRVMLIYNGEKNGAPAEAQRSGFGGEKRGKVTECSFPRQRGTERSGFRPDAIAGTFLLCGFEGDSFTSLTPAQQAEFEEGFAKPGEFMLIGTKTVCASLGELVTNACKLWEGMKSGESVVLTKWGGSPEGGTSA